MSKSTSMNEPITCSLQLCHVRIHLSHVIKGEEYSNKINGSNNGDDDGWTHDVMRKHLFNPLSVYKHSFTWLSQ